MYASAVAGESSSTGGQRLAFWGAFSLFLLAGGTLYAVGLKVAGLVVAGIPIILGTLLYPQIGAYVYFALPAWDAASVSAVGAVISPAKLFSIPFLIGFLVAAMRRPVHLRESRSFVILALVYAVWAFVPAAFSVAMAPSRLAGLGARGSSRRASPLSNVVTETATRARLRAAMGARISASRIGPSDLVVMVTGWLHRSSTSRMPRVILSFRSMGW